MIKFDTDTHPPGKIVTKMLKVNNAYFKVFVYVGINFRISEETLFSFFSIFILVHFVFNTLKQHINFPVSLFSGNLYVFHLSRNIKYTDFK